MWINAGDIAIPAAFRADFVQTITNPEKKVIRYEGEVLFSEPSRMKWVYLKPTRKEVCTDGKDILLVEHELEQVSRYRMRKPFDLAAIVKHAKPVKERIYTAAYEGKVYTLRVDEKGRVDSIAFSTMRTIRCSCSLPIYERVTSRLRLRVCDAIIRPSMT
jgi:outer membrane lipoprotein carrier protein